MGPVLALPSLFMIENDTIFFTEQTLDSLHFTSLHFTYLLLSNITHLFNLNIESSVGGVRVTYADLVGLAIN